jgi:hypothetical protein
MSKVFINPRQVEEWVEAAKGIQDRFGIDKALGYVVGEKFYKLVAMLHISREIIRTIEEKKKASDYNPFIERTLRDKKYIVNLDETYEREQERLLEAEELLIKFTVLIKQAFDHYEIRKYFSSHPRFGAWGHILSEEEHELMIQKGAAERSIETEVEDALILGEMMRYFDVLK